MTAPIPCFLNPRAGTLRSPGPAAVGAALARAGVACELHAVNPGELAPALRDAAARGVPVIGVGGGDGTVRTAAGAIAGTDTALAVLPMGTLNHFAQRIGIADLDAAIRAIRTGQRIAVSVGMVNDEVFLNTAVFGEYVRVVRRRERWRRFIGKWPAATLAFIAVLLRARPMNIALQTSDDLRRHTTPLLWVGLGRGTFPRVAWSDLTDGPARELEVVVARSRVRFARLRILTRFMTSMHDRNAASAHPHLLEILHARQLGVMAGRDMHATLDGEIHRFGRSVEIQLRHDVLNVLTPANGSAR